jgi:hypothetical protein
MSGEASEFAGAAEPRGAEAGAMTTEAILMEMLKATREASLANTKAAEAMAQVAATTSTRNLALPPGLKVDGYHPLEEGRRNVRPWVDGIERWLYICNWKVETPAEHLHAIYYFAGRMVGKTATSWFNARVAQHHNQAGGFSTLQEFMLGLLGACGEQNVEERSRDRLLVLKQTRHVTHYSEKFASYAAALPADEGTGWLRHLYMRGLKQELRAMIIGKFQEGASWQDVAVLAAKHDGLGQQSAGQDSSTPMELGALDSASSSDGESLRGRERRKGSPHPRAVGTGARHGMHGAERSGGKGRNKGNCFHCDLPGHWKKECPKLVAVRSEPMRGAKSSKKGGQ